MNIVKAGTHSIGTSFHYLLSLDMWCDYAFLSCIRSWLYQKFDEVLAKICPNLLPNGHIAYRGIKFERIYQGKVRKRPGKGKQI